jgi:hypothetical protein
MKTNQTLIDTSSSNSSAVATIVRATIASGLLDATAGVVVYWIYKGLNPLQVLQYIASGIFGPAVINGSFLYVIIGLLLHFVIAFAFTCAYFLAFPFIKSFCYKWFNLRSFYLGVHEFSRIAFLEHTTFAKGFCIST